MRSHKRMIAALILSAGAVVPAAGAQDIEAIVARHMVAEARLTAHLIALATRAGLSGQEVRAILKDVADNTVIDEFWITGPDGETEFSNQTLAFTFSPDPDEQPQASAFWPLLEDAEVVVQKAQVREIDDQVFKYVGVAGIDEKRIVQVGVAADHLLSAEDR